MTIERPLRETLTAFELDHGDTIELVRDDGRRHRIELLSTRAAVQETNLKQLKVEEPNGRTVLRMHADLRIDGEPFSIIRWVGSQKSFYEPWEFNGLRLWFDAADALFEHVSETHGSCRPRKAARFAVEQADREICPVLLHPWCPLPEGSLRIEDAYMGMDCWLGPYMGASAHGGLDINHRAGTPIWTPFAIDDHGYFNSVAAGENNNRWRGWHTWPDGSTWTIQVHHIIRLRVPEHEPIEAGRHLADSAGVWVGSAEHTHFVFGVTEPGEPNDADHRILLDPWILFWQMYRDRRRTREGR